MGGDRNSTPPLIPFPDLAMTSLKGLVLVNTHARLGHSDLRVALAPIERIGAAIAYPSRPPEVWEFPDYLRSEGGPLIL